MHLEHRSLVVELEIEDSFDLLVYLLGFGLLH
jgi:hypothetical protein